MSPLPETRSRWQRWANPFGLRSIEFVCFYAFTTAVGITLNHVGLHEIPIRALIYCFLVMFIWNFYLKQTRFRNVQPSKFPTNGASTICTLTDCPKRQESVPVEDSNRVPLGR